MKMPGMPYLARLVLLAMLLLAAPLQADTVADRLLQERLAQGYVTALLLTDGDNVRLGFLNFDPNTILPVDDDLLGNDLAVAERDRLAFFSLPTRWRLPRSDARSAVSVGVRASLMEEREEVFLGGEEALQRDQVTTRHMIASTDLLWRHHLSERWKVDSAIAAHYIHLRNNTDFNSAESLAVAPLFDGLATNFSSRAWLLSPKVALRRWVGAAEKRLEYFSVITYMNGRAIAPDRNAHDAEPEAWHWSNGVERKFLVHRGSVPQTVMTRFARVDVGGDLLTPVGTNYYYELGVGWYSAVPETVPLVDNAGLILNFNYGSNFRGGTVGFLLNVE